MKKPDTGPLSDLIQRASRKAQSIGSEVFASHSQMIDPVDPLDVFTAAENITSDRWYWEHPDGDRAIVSVGILTGTTPPRNIRFQEIGRQVRQYASSATVESDARVANHVPTLFAAFSFDPRHLQDRLVWQGFPSAYLLAPRLTVIREGSSHTLTQNVLVTPNLDAESILNAARTFSDELIAALDDQKTSEFIVDEIPPDKTNEKEIRQYVSAIARGESAIRSGDFDVLNIARRQKITTGGLYRLNKALRYLRGRYPHARIVAAGRHGSTFIGYSASTLVRKQGSEITAECSVGTIRRGEAPDLDSVLASQLTDAPEELEHHELCVDQLHEALEELCDDVVATEDPEVQSTSENHYLSSIVTGTARAGTSLLDVVGALHPAVATCGSPVAQAADFVHEQEQTDRGWFASPFGWIDLNGNGEFIAATHAVVVRAPVLAQQRAYLFTSTAVHNGADPEDHIIRSDRELEGLRTALKQ